MTGPYKLTSKMTDNYTLGITATPQMEAITALYKKISSGIDQELIRNMPNSAIYKLLSQLLEEFIGRQGLEGKDAHEARMMLTELETICGVY